MNRSAPMSLRFCLAAASGLLFAGNALAFEPEALFERYARQWRSAGMQAAYVSAQTTGENGVIYEGVTIGRDGATTKIQSLRLEGIAPDGADGYLIGNALAGPITFDTVDSDGKPVALRIDSVRGSGIRLPASGTGEPVVSRDVPLQFELENLSLLVDGAAMLTIPAAMSQAGFDASGTTMVFTGDIPSIAMAFEAAPPRVKGQMAALGLETLQLSARARGSWNLASGRLTIDEYRLAAKDAGTLSLSLAIDGYTAQKAGAIALVSERLDNLGTARGEAKQEAGREMMALLGELKIASIKLSFEDGSLTGKLLAIQAQAMGAPPEELAPVFAGLAGEQVAALLGDGFGRQFFAAFNGFLANPGTFSLVASPPEPVAITQLVGAFLNSPSGIAAMLNANVSAQGK